MDKKTTAQVAKAFGMTKQRLYHILARDSALRPMERVDKLQRYLWSAEEIEALNQYLVLHPRRGYRVK